MVNMLDSISTYLVCSVTVSARGSRVGKADSGGRITSGPKIVELMTEFHIANNF